MTKGQQFLILNCLITYLNAANSKGYGLLKMKVESVDICRGPKRRDCCVPVVTILGGAKLTFDFLVNETVTLTSGKVLATSEGKELVKFQMKKPCDNFLIKSLFSFYLHLTEDCAVPKGRHVFTADFQEINEKYYGGRYFYGNITVRSIFSGNDCNFFCTMTHLVISPRNS